MNTEKKKKDSVNLIVKSWKGIVVGLILSLGLSFLPSSILAIPVVIISLIALLIVADLKSSSAKEGGNIIFFVPQMYAFIRRNRFFSNTGTPLYDEEPEPKEEGEETDKERKERKKKIAKKRKPKGYKAFKQGLGWKIPGLHVNEGLVSLKPIQRDIKEMVVNSSDKQPVMLDLQMTSSITNPERFVINVPGQTMTEKEENRKKLENELLHTAANSTCSSYNSEQIQARMLRFEKNDYKGQAWKKLQETLEENLACIEAQKRKDTTDKKDDIPTILKDKKEEWGKIFGKKSYAVPLDLGYEIKIQLYLLQIKDFYGISINQVGVQKIYNPPDIQKALEKEKTAEIKKRFSQITGQASGEEMGEAIKNTAEIASIDPNIAAFVYGLAKFFTPKSGDTKTTGGSK